MVGRPAQRLSRMSVIRLKSEAMPNCDFYALEADALSVIEFVLEKTDCAVYEHYSAPGQELQRFDSLAALRRVLVAADSSANFQLYSSSMKGLFRIRKIELDPGRFPVDPWRFESHGWGAIQLQFGGLREGRILHSHTNHNSEKRALAWEATHRDDLGAVAAWDWPEVVRISRALNRFIRRCGVSKTGSRPVLPAAHEAVASGIGTIGTSASAV